MDLLSYVYKSLEKKLSIGFINCSGRNFSGKICVYHRATGNKKNLYKIDFFRRIQSRGFIVKIIKVSFFSSFLGLIIYNNGLTTYHLLTESLKVKDNIFSGYSLLKDDEIKLGYSLPIKNFNILSIVHNLELCPNKGGKYIRAAGSFGLITSIEKDRSLLKLKSGWNIWISNDCIATQGMSANSQHRFYRYKKAGHLRGMGKRPVVRGVAMNPCDHPHGGGEGRKSPNVCPRSPWGWLTKGTPTKIKKFQIKRKKRGKDIRGIKL